MSSLFPQRWRMSNSNGHNDYYEWYDGLCLNRMYTESTPTYMRASTQWECVRNPWAETWDSDQD